MSLIYCWNAYCDFVFIKQKIFKMFQRHLEQNGELLNKWISRHGEENEMDL